MYSDVMKTAFFGEMEFWCWVEGKDFRTCKIIMFHGTFSCWREIIMKNFYPRQNVKRTGLHLFSGRFMMAQCNDFRCVFLFEFAEDPFTEAEARKFFQEILLGVEHLHARRIVHRDL